MALNFDVNSALAGARATSGIISDMYYKPEEMRMAQEKHALSQKQGEAALENTLLDTKTKKDTISREATLRESSGREAAANTELLRLQNIFSNPAGASAEELKAGFAIKHSEPGKVEMFRKMGYDPNRIANEILAPIDSAKQSYQNMLQGKGTQADIDNMNKAVGIMYANTTGKTIDPNKVTVNVDPKTGKAIVYNDGTPISTFNDPTELAMILDKDARRLREAINDEKVLRASLGDVEASKYINSRRSIADQVSELRKSVILPESRTQLDMALKAEPEQAQKLIDAIQKDTSELMKSKRLAKVTKDVKTELDKQIAEIESKTKGRKGARGAIDDMRDLDKLEAMIQLSPKLKAEIEAQGLDPDTYKAAVFKEHFGRKKDIATLEVDLKKAEAAYLSAGNSSGKGGELYNKTLQQYQKNTEKALMDLNKYKNDSIKIFATTDPKILMQDAGYAELYKNYEEASKQEQLFKARGASAIPTGTSSRFTMRGMNVSPEAEAELN